MEINRTMCIQCVATHSQFQSAIEFHWNHIANRVVTINGKHENEKNNLHRLIERHEKANRKKKNTIEETNSNMIIIFAVLLYNFIR